MLEEIGDMAILTSMGLPGAIITVLMSVISVLTGTIVYMQKRADKIYGYRLHERDTLKDAFHESSQSIAMQAAAIQDRNTITNELSETIKEQTQAITFLIERLTIQHNHLVGDHDKVASVVTSIAEALRNVAHESHGVKQTVDQLLVGVPGISKDIRDQIKGLVSEFEKVVNRRGR